MPLKNGDLLFLNNNVISKNTITHTAATHYTDQITWTMLIFVSLHMFILTLNIFQFIIPVSTFIFFAFTILFF